MNDADRLYAQTLAQLLGSDTDSTPDIDQAVTRLRTAAEDSHRASSGTGTATAVRPARPGAGH